MCDLLRIDTGRGSDASCSQSKILNQRQAHLPLSWNIHLQRIHCGHWMPGQDQPGSTPRQSLCHELWILNRCYMLTSFRLLDKYYGVEYTVITLCEC